MLDRNTFMETLHSVQEIAGVSGKKMDRETALSYFKDMELTEEQKELIYQFLLLEPEESEALEEPEESEALEEPEGLEALGESGGLEALEEPEALGEPEDLGEPGESVEASGRFQEQTHFQMYRDEVEEIKEVEAAQELQMYQELLKGDASLIAPIATQWTKRIIGIAEDYQHRGSLLDDLVQEGNIGLLMELHQMCGSWRNAMEIRLADISLQLRDAVKNAIELYLGAESGEEQQSETILAKVSLVHEARKLLAQENGEQPSLRQLAEYTRISEDEISDILSLVKKRGQ